MIGIDRLQGDLFDGQSHKSETMLLPEYNIACEQSLIWLQKKLDQKAGGQSHRRLDDKYF